MQCTNNVVMFYVRWFWRMLYMYYSIIIIELYYKSIHHKKAKIIKCTYISIIIIQLKYWEIFLLKKKTKKKPTLKEYYRIKVDIECVFLFLLNFKTKYTSQTPTINHIIYKTHKPIASDLNIKIVIAIVIQYKMQAPFPWL